MPTTSRSSPRTTSAVNEKRRPPLTTLATRLISTTRSCRSRPEEETVRSRMTGISRSRLAGLEVQPALAGPVGERLHAPVASIPAPIEHRALDTGGASALGQQRAGALSLLHRPEAAEVGFGPVDRGHGPPGVGVDQLGEDAAIGAEHRDARALGAATDLGPHAAAPPESLSRLGENGHARLPTF